MKCCKFFAFVTVAVLFDHASALFLHGGQANGNVQFSGNFHGLLANHPWLAPKEEAVVQETTEAPTTTTTTTTTVAPAPAPAAETNAVATSGSASSSIGFNAIIGGAIDRHVKILQHVQHGLVSRLDNHIHRLERFDNHVKNHFNKGASGSSGSSVSIRGDFDFGPTKEGDNVSTL